MATIHILRHGQALHNVQRGYAHRDPPLTELGIQQAKNVQLPAQPDLIIVSPMTRTIQMTLLVFQDVLNASPAKVTVEVWPELRECYDALCNQGVSRAAISTKFPQLDFSRCDEEWDYPPHTAFDAYNRAELVRRRLKSLSRFYENIFVVTHRCFISFLAKGARFDVCEYRSYKFLYENEFSYEEETDEMRFGANCDTGELQDFGPNVLLPAFPARENDEATKT
ncbi:hypothetical protein QQX98_000004 [Neonectria punicea]|uniref:Phosphoglycerate mutase-like protein n=1 Tax=Neonectria punicea TaxID=979145 RepID=A0ABR1HW42_9HYPO